jgi:hypothetical protein
LTTRSKYRFAREIEATITEAILLPKGFAGQPAFYHFFVCPKPRRAAGINARKPSTVETWKTMTNKGRVRGKLYS